MRRQSRSSIARSCRCVHRPPSRRSMPSGLLRKAVDASCACLAQHFDAAAARPAHSATLTALVRRSSPLVPAPPHRRRSRYGLGGRIAAGASSGIARGAVLRCKFRTCLVADAPPPAGRLEPKAAAARRSVNRDVARGFGLRGASAPHSAAGAHTPVASAEFFTRFTPPKSRTKWTSRLKCNSTRHRRLRPSPRRLHAPVA